MINTNDVHNINKRQDKNILNSVKSQYRHNQGIIKRHHRNHKLVNKLENRNSFLQIKFHTDNTNNRLKMDRHNHHSHANSTAKNLAEMRKQTLKLVNQDRAETTGNAPLREDPELDQIAQMRAEQASSPKEENSSDPHDDPNTRNAYYREDADQLGYHDLDNNSSGENLAWGSTTAKGFNNLWFTEERPYRGGHYRNIVGDTKTPAPSHFTRIGFGYYKNTAAEDFAGNDD